MGRWPGSCYKSPVGDDPKVDFICFFCGFARDDGEQLTVGAFWNEAGDRREQYWPAHRNCMIKHMSGPTREMGGPLTRD
jgi:hypothetical protein